jgi:RimJ/RimL family protein N-acetyltransferase
MESRQRQNLIIAQVTSNRLIRQVSCYWISEETNWLAAGVVIYDQSSWSQGYGTEALGLWTSYLFDTLPNFVRLDLQTWSDNSGMIKIGL